MNTPRPLSDYFTTIETDKAKAPEAAKYNPSGTRPLHSPIGPYCTVSDSTKVYGNILPSLWVYPSDEVMDFIAGNMLLIDYDSIYFSLIRPVGGTDYVLYAKYNQILGSRVIGYVTADSIPNGA